MGSLTRIHGAQFCSVERVVEFDPVGEISRKGAIAFGKVEDDPLIGEFAAICWPAALPRGKVGSGNGRAFDSEPGVPEVAPLVRRGGGHGAELSPSKIGQWREVEREEGGEKPVLPSRCHPLLLAKRVAGGNLSGAQIDEVAEPGRRAGGSSVNPLLPRSWSGAPFGSSDLIEE